MSLRIFEKLRSGNWGFLPRKRTRDYRRRVRSFLKYDALNKPHFTEFMDWKTGMTNITKNMHRLDSRLYKKKMEWLNLS